jgi:hypothetical protein
MTLDHVGSQAEVFPYHPVNESDTVGNRQKLLDLGRNVLIQPEPTNGQDIHVSLVAGD